MSASVCQYTFHPKSAEAYWPICCIIIVSGLYVICSSIFRETSSIKVNDIASQIANNVGAAVEATNARLVAGGTLAYHYNRRNPKRRRLMEASSVNSHTSVLSDASAGTTSEKLFAAQEFIAQDDRKNQGGEVSKLFSETGEDYASLSKMVAVLCEQHLFLPLLRAFEMFLPSCSLLPFIRALQVWF